MKTVVKRLVLAGFCTTMVFGAAHAQETLNGVLGILGAQMGHADAASNCPNSNQDQIAKDQLDYKDQADQAILGERLKISHEAALRPFRIEREKYARSFAGKCADLRNLHPEWFSDSRSSGNSSSSGESCNDLWQARNAIYKEAGYCFKTAKAIKAFGNAGCSHDNIASVPLSAAQRQRVSEIVRQEQAMRCPK